MEFFLRKKKNIKPKQYLKVFYQAQGEPVWSKFNYVNTSREAYVKNVVANGCISVVVNGASSVKLKLKNRRTDVGGVELKDYNIDYSTGEITIKKNYLSENDIITADFEFDYQVRFTYDSLKFEMTSANLGKISNLELIEI